MPLLPVSAVQRLAGSRIDWSALWTIDNEADDWLIGPIIARGRGHALYAPAKAGKSLLTLYLAACAATGRPVLDHGGGEPVRTLYVDAEMTGSDVRERLVDMGFGPDDDLSALAYYSLPAVAVLDSEAGGAEILELAQAHHAELVIIDTLGRVLGGEENSADTLRAYYRHTGGPLKAAGIATLRADHAGKDLERGMRGTSAKADDVDVVWQLIRRDHGRFDLKATHRRMGWVPEVVHLQQTDDPLAYRMADDTWPAGTQAAVDVLNRLELPVEIGRTKARAAVKLAGEKVSTDALGAALRWRRSEAQRATARPDEVEP